MYKFLVLIFLLFVFSASAQERDTTEQDMSAHHHKIDEGMKPAQHGHSGGVLLTVPMSMEGSGTSWQPKDSPMYMKMFSPGEWMLMLHGATHLRYTKQGGNRGSDAFSAPNWLMGMVQRPLGEESQLMIRTMLSLDRLTEGGNGYPLLLQTGETWEGVRLVDRQHPHDMFTEISVALSTRISESLSGFLYFGYPGEPALGPPVFMHRVSAMFNPDAPLGHHWQDATHISFGVATVGFAVEHFKVEGSLFTGREPDENRFDFDKPRFDSYSARVSFNPSSEFALQISAGNIINPEGDDEDVVRSSASALYSERVSSETYLTAALVWGQNDDHHSGKQNSLLLESSLNFRSKAVYGRIEFVEKPLTELGILIDPDSKEFVSAYTLGFNQNVWNADGFAAVVGLQATINGFSEKVSQFYGKSPLSFQMYFSFHPSL